MEVFERLSHRLLSLYLIVMSACHITFYESELYVNICPIQFFFRQSKINTLYRDSYFRQESQYHHILFIMSALE